MITTKLLRGVLMSACCYSALWKPISANVMILSSLSLKMTIILKVIYYLEIVCHNFEILSHYFKKISHYNDLQDFFFHHNCANRLP